jgi:hypothetical protein
VTLSTRARIVVRFPYRDIVPLNTDDLVPGYIQERLETPFLAKRKGEAISQPYVLRSFEYSLKPASKKWHPAALLKENSVIPPC